MPIADNRGNEFGTELRRLRVAAGLSQGELAERAQLSAETISALERGARRTPYRSTIELLSSALGLSEYQRNALAEVAVRRRGPRTLTHGLDADGETPRLPLYATVFFDREAERADIKRLLGGARLLTLCGPGGVGKTRLAIEAAAQVAGSFSDGVCFAGLASLRDAAYVLSTVAAATQAPNRAAQSLEALVAALATRQLLLIVDNCEHVIDECARTIEAILQGCPQVRIVATSRQQLAVDGETLYRLDPLDAGGAAIELFLNRSAVSARDAAAPFDLAVVASIAQRLDGIPLAIELAAAMARLQPIDQIETALRGGTFLASAAKRTAVERQRTMEATLAWSYDLLEGVEREALRLLAYPVAGTTWDGACALLSASAEETNARVRRLIEASLLSEHPATRRLRLHEVTRQFAASQTDSAESDVAARRYGAWLANAMAGATSGQFPSSYGRLFVLAPELDNIRQAFARALSTQDRSLALDLASGLDFWTAIARTPEGYRWLSRVRDELEPDDADPRSATLYIGIAMCAIQSGLPAAALEPAQKAGEIASRLGQAVLRGRVFIITGFLRLSRGDLETAVSHFEQACKLFTLSTPAGFFRSRCFAGFTYIELDRGEDAENALEDVSVLVEQFAGAPDPSDEALVAALRSEVVRLRGDTPDSIEAARRAIELLGDFRTGAHLRAYYSLVDGLIATGDLDEAAAVAAGEVRSLHERGFVPDVALFLERLALIAVRKDRPTFAARILGWSDSTLEDTGRVRLRFDRENHRLVSEMLGAMLAPERVHLLFESGRASTREEIVIFATAL